MVVDKRPVGLAPVSPLKVRAGLHLVEVLVRGRAPQVTTVFVPPGGEVEVTVRLARKAAGAPVAAQEAPGGPIAATPRGPIWRLSGAAALTAAALEAGQGGEGAQDLDLNQRWRLEAQRLLGPEVSGSLQVRSFTDIDASDPEGPLAGLADGADGLAQRQGDPRELEPGETRTTALIDELALRWRGAGGALQLTGGRAPAMGPGGRAWTRDGVAARWRPGGLISRLSAEGGRVAAVYGPDLDPVGLGGGGLSLALGRPGRSASLDADTLAVRGYGLHTDLNGRSQVGAARVWARGRWIDDERAELRLRGRWTSGALQLRLGVQRRWPVQGPFEHPFEGLRPRLSIEGPGLPDWWAARAGAHWQGDRLRLWLRGARRAPPGDPSALRPALWSGQVGGGGPLPAGLQWRAEGEWIESDVGPVAPQAALLSRRAARLSLIRQAGRWRYGGGLGVARLAVQSNDGSRRGHTLPEGHVEVAVAVDARVTFSLTGSRTSVHPAWLPGGGPWSRAMLMFRLR